MAKTRFTSPVGRMVQGSVDEPQTKDAQGNLRVVKAGPNAGQPNPQFFMAVAFPKADPQGEFSAFYGLLVQQAAADFPALFPQGPGGACVHPQFSFKVIDGDGLDQNGQSNAGKEGFAGHWVVRFASSYPPRCFHAGRYAANEQIQEKGVIRRGYYVRVSGSTEGNGNPQRPGLYLNLDMVELSAYGPEITSGPDAGQAFAAPVNLPVGASATPLTPPATPGAPGNPPYAPLASASPPYAPPAAAAPAPVAPPAVATPPVPGASSAAANPAAPPYAGFMQPPGQPAAPAASPAPPAGPGYSAPPATAYPGSAPAAPVAPPPPAPPPPAAPPPAAPGRVMLPAANGATYEQLIAAGWTDDTLRQHGMMQ